MLIHGTVADTTRSAVEAGRPRKLSALFDFLVKRRATFDKSNPGKRYPGTVRLSAQPDTAGVAFASALLTALIAGHELIEIESSSGNLTMRVRGVPRRPGMALRRTKTLHVLLEGSETIVTTKFGSTTVSEERYSAHTDSAAAGKVLTDAVVAPFRANSQPSDGHPKVMLHLHFPQRFAVIESALMALKTAQEVLTRPDSASPFSLWIDASGGRWPAFVPSPATPPANPAKPSAGGRKEPARVRVGNVRLRGGKLSEQEVRKELSSKFGDFQACYHEALARKPELTGNVTLTIAVEKTGLVDGVTSAATLKAPRLLLCIEQQVLDVVFPSPKAPTTITYSLELTPGPCPASISFTGRQPLVPCR